VDDEWWYLSFSSGRQNIFDVTASSLYVWDATLAHRCKNIVLGIKEKENTTRCFDDFTGKLGWVDDGGGHSVGDGDVSVEPPLYIPAFSDVTRSARAILPPPSKYPTSIF